MPKQFLFVHSFPDSHPRALFHFPSLHLLSICTGIPKIHIIRGTSIFIALIDIIECCECVLGDFLTWPASITTLVGPIELLSNVGICAKCARLDLGGALQTATRIRRRNNDTNGTALSEVIRIASVGSQYRKPPLPGCVLCPILFASRISPEQGLIDNDHGDEIRLFGLLDHLYMIQPTSTLRKFDSALLATVPRQFGTGHDLKRLKVHVQNEGAAVLSQGGLETARFAAKAVPNSFDVKIVNHWLRDCQGTHTSLLCGVSTNSTVSAIRRLIDCTTLSIGDAESNTPYVALSYVWGNPGDINNQLQHAGYRLLLPERVSATISDAISVTKALGFQYLWVDKFCIDQDDAAVKHEQIKQMNVIYENAELTIVAAAGVDETYGLPGVGQRPRTPQGAATFNGLSVISTMKDPHISIRSSRWASRGWTFQEALLSRRRLFFTDQQLYFECDAMNCFESIHNLWRRNDVLRVGLFGRGTDKTYGENVPGKSTLRGRFLQYLSAVKDYSSRELTYDSDSLIAFEGIIQRYSKLEHPLTAICGIPYPAKWGDRILYCCWALTWIHTKSCWVSSRRPRRRQQFPSWTWAGWAGAVETWQESASRWERKNSYLHGIRSVRFGNGDDHDEGLN